MKIPKETLTPVRRQKERAALTREKILLSANRIFVRDGFEAAKLDEIATAAGYTRGAFYANYKNKEELFVAVAGQQIANHISIAVESVRSKTGVKSKIHELLQNMSNTPEARTWVILMIEFSLFVLRHPEQKSQLLLLHEPCIKGAEAVFRDLYKEADRDPALSLSSIGIGFYSLIQGLILQEMVNGKRVTPKVTADLLKTYLHAVLGDESKPEE
jgi:AcrR family transcriptional regulator